MVHACLYVCWCASVNVVGVGAVMCVWVCVGVCAIVFEKSRAQIPEITHTHTNLTALMRPSDGPATAPAPAFVYVHKKDSVAYLPSLISNLSLLGA